MDISTIVLIAVAATVIGVAIGTAGADVLVGWFRNQKKVARKRKPARKDRSGWITRNQLEILDTIRKNGRSGIPLWHTEINLSTIRSLAKRGFVNCRPGFRIVITRAGKKRLHQPWPAIQPVGDQKDRPVPVGSTTEEISPAASQEASQPDSLDNRV